MCKSRALCPSDRFLPGPDQHKCASFSHFDIAALSNVAVLQRLHDAIRLLLERFPPPCCNICSGERSGHPRREACDQLRHAVSHWGVCPPYWFISSCAELMTFPASAPQLVYQMLWYVPPCLCSSAYTRAGHCVPMTGFYLVLTSINVHHSPTSIMITVQQHEEYSDPTSQSCCWHQYHFPEQVEIFNSIINTRSNIYSST